VKRINLVIGDIIRFIYYTDIPATHEDYIVVQEPQHGICLIKSTTTGKLSTFHSDLSIEETKIILPRSLIEYHCLSR